MQSGYTQCRPMTVAERRTACVSAGRIWNDDKLVCLQGMKPPQVFEHKGAKILDAKTELSLMIVDQNRTVPPNNLDMELCYVSSDVETQWTGSGVGEPPPDWTLVESMRDVPRTLSAPTGVLQRSWTAWRRLRRTAYARA